MTENHVVNIIRDNVERQFPKLCGSCGRKFVSLRDYLLNTRHIGAPHSYDAEMENWRPEKPFGTYSFSDCRCGNTLALGSDMMSVYTMWILLWWAKKEFGKRNISFNELLYELRSKVDAQALAEE